MKITISFGATSPPIVDQLRQQGFKLDLAPVDRGRLQRDADEVARLRIRCVLTESESDKAQKRIFQIIKKQAKPL